MGSVIRGAKAYLSDWRNWVTHGLVGLGFMALAIWAPVDWRIKLVVIAIVVTFNVIRMRRAAAKKAASAPVADEHDRPIG